MGWFDGQIRERSENDGQLLEDAFIHASGVVLGKKQKLKISDKHSIINNEINSIIEYYRYESVQIPDNIETVEEKLDYSLRHYGIMRREIQLADRWYKDGMGPILAFRKDTGLPVALLPGKAGRYHYNEPGSIRNIKINAINARHFSDRAICFYNPLPMKKIGIMDLLKYMKSYVNFRDIIRIFLAAYMLVMLGILSPRLTKIITGPILDSGRHELLMGIAVFMICLSVTLWLIEIIKALLATKIRGKVSIGINAAVMMRMMSMPAGFFKEYSVGELRNRQAAISDLCDRLLNIILDVGLSVMFSLLYLSQIHRIAGVLVPTTVEAIVMTLIVTVVVTYLQIKLGRREMKSRTKEAGVSFEMISGIKKIKLTGAENRMFARWLNRYSEWANLKFNPPKLIKAGPVIVMGISLINYMSFYLMATLSELSQSSFYAFTVAYGTLMGSFTLLSDSAVSLGSIRPAFELAKPILQTAPETGKDREIVSRLSGRIEAEHIYFRYSEDSPYILNDVSITIEPGEYVAIVGETGCGKSTLMRLLLGFEKLDRGNIYYDGKEIGNIDITSLRQKIGTVMQNGGLFQGDIYSNIVISAPELTVDDAWEAAEIAGIADDIRNMPMGMNTLISEGSGSISGGQKQRIMIARAVATKPKVLFLDEATSALDNMTQKHVANALDSMGCTRIVIAHRLSTIRHCDRIVLLKGGRIAEDGTYEELIDKGGFFAELVERQRLDLA